MSELEDLKRRLYTKGGTEKPKPSFLEHSVPRPEEVKKAWGEISETEERESPMAEKKKNRWRIGLLAVGLFLLGGIAIAGIFYFGFQQESLAVTVLAKERAESGERITYQVFYKNNGSQTLQDIELSFTYPAGAIPLKEDRIQAGAYRTSLPLANLSPGEEAKVELEARLYGKQDETKKAEAVFVYRLQNSSSRFNTKASADTLIVRVPLVITMDIPKEAVSGQKVEINIDYSSNASSPFENMFLGIEYPSGFEFLSADPKPDLSNNIWNIRTLKPGDSGKIKLSGALTGPPAEIKIFSFQMGLYEPDSGKWTPYQTASANSKISTPLLSIEQRINESRDAIVKPGDNIRIRLHYKNVLDIPLRNVRVEVGLTGIAVDLKTLSVPNGAYDATAGSIVWTPASFPTFASLPAQAEGDISFQVQLKPAASADLSGSKNLTVVSKARISSPDKPAGLEGVDLSAEDTISAKLSTRLVLSSRLLYQNQYFANSGPLPPKVGNKTTYTAVWEVANSLNDLTSVEVRATLLPGVSWEKLFVPKGQSAAFDSASGIVTWRIGAVPAGSGISRSGPELAFQIGFTPGEDQIGKSPDLIRNIEASAIDAFTGESVLVKVGELSTRLQSDSSTDSKQWSVVP